MNRAQENAERAAQAARELAAAELEYFAPLSQQTAGQEYRRRQAIAARYLAAAAPFQKTNLTDDEKHA